PRLDSRRGGHDNSARRRHQLPRLDRIPGRNCHRLPRMESSQARKGPSNDEEVGSAELKVPSAERAVSYSPLSTRHAVLSTMSLPPGPTGHPITGVLRDYRRDPLG